MTDQNTPTQARPKFWKAIDQNGQSITNVIAPDAPTAREKISEQLNRIGRREFWTSWNANAQEVRQYGQGRLYDFCPNCQGAGFVDRRSCPYCQESGISPVQWNHGAKVAHLLEIHFLDGTMTPHWIRPGDRVQFGDIDQTFPLDPAFGFWKQDQVRTAVQVHFKDAHQRETGRLETAQIRAVIWIKRVPAREIGEY